MKLSKILVLCAFALAFATSTSLPYLSSDAHAIPTDQKAKGKGKGGTPVVLPPENPITQACKDAINALIENLPKECTQCDFLGGGGKPRVCAEAGDETQITQIPACAGMVRQAQQYFASKKPTIPSTCFFPTPEGPVPTK